MGGTMIQVKCSSGNLGTPMISSIFRVRPIVLDWFHHRPRLCPLLVSTSPHSLQPGALSLSVVFTLIFLWEAHLHCFSSEDLYLNKSVALIPEWSNCSADDFVIKQDDISPKACSSSHLQCSRGHCWVGYWLLLRAHSHVLDSDSLVKLV